jgi:4-alpha-glucanotransferase
MSDLSSRRRAGLVIPLFSCPSTASWGIGEIGDVASLTQWMASAGAQVLQLLPLNERALGQSSPYSPISAMAIDPIFITLAAVPEFAALGGEGSLSGSERALLDQVRRAERIDHTAVGRLKSGALERAFDRFYETEWRRETERARELRGFLAEQAWWIEDYALFRALRVHEGERPWTEWPLALQRREPAAIDQARRELGREVLYRQYLQWLATTQWLEARRAANGVALFGDLPFMVDGDSADVWARQQEFDLDVSVGAPPDGFSKTGQDWGMPAYRWEALPGEDYRWLRERARRTADLYDGYRIDHVVGFYRTYARPRDGREPFFMPSSESAQLAQGERVMALFKETSGEVLAEDLGTVPDFVRASLGRLAIPGFRIFRWERHWNVEGQPFRDPSDYPALSVAASGTHDTEPLIVWWESASAEDRALVSALPSIQRAAAAPIDTVSPERAGEAIVEALFASESKLLLLPVQDVFGWRDRVNDPAVVDGVNWTFKLPWPSDRLDDIPEARHRRDQFRAWTLKHGRCK